LKSLSVKMLRLPRGTGGDHKSAIAACQATEWQSTIAATGLEPLTKPRTNIKAGHARAEPIEATFFAPHPLYRVVRCRVGADWTARAPPEPRSRQISDAQKNQKWRLGETH